MGCLDPFLPHPTPLGLIKVQSSCLVFSGQFPGFGKYKESRLLGLRSTWFVCCGCLDERKLKMIVFIIDRFSENPSLIFFSFSVNISLATYPTSYSLDTCIIYLLFRPKKTYWIIPRLSFSDYCYLLQKQILLPFSFIALQVDSDFNWKVIRK